MKDIMNIAVVNFASEWGDKPSNLKRILEYCEAAGRRGADFIVFPETALSGYDTDKAHPKAEMMHTKLAETIPGPSTEKWLKWQNSMECTLFSVCRKKKMV